MPRAPEVSVRGVFSDRRDAARQLARRLDRLRAERPVVAAVTAGAVPLAAELAALLGAELHVVLVSSVGHPLVPGHRVAAVDEAGRVTPRESHGLSDAELRVLARHDVSRLRRLRSALDVVHEPVVLAGRPVVAVDDGIVSGATMTAGVRALRRSGAARVVAASPVATAAAVARLRDEADEVVALAIPPSVEAVRDFYASYPRVTDEEVLATLGESALPRAA